MLRFAAIVGVSLSIAAVAIVAATRYLNQQEAERNAATHARFVAHSLLADTLATADFQAPVQGRRKRELDRFFAQRVVVDGTKLVMLLGRGGATYASDRKLAIGSTLAEQRVAEAMDGTITSSTGSLKTSESKPLKVLETYVPVEGGVAVLYQDYAPIAAAARAAFLPIAGTLELAVLVLFALLVPILARVTRSMRQQMERIHHQAYHDDLTGLPNRLSFRETLDRRLASHPAGAIMMIDLDGFKDVNDTLGHDVGDDLLRRVPERLLSALPSRAILARLGGDEFAVLLPDANADDALLTGSAIRRKLERPFQLDHLSLALDASIGIAETPAHGTTADIALKNADTAMYVAKKERSGCAVYHPGQHTLDPERLRLLAELREALENGQVVPYYQPKLSLLSNAVVGVEALARWEHPELGLIASERWIPLAEQSGLHEQMLRRILGSVTTQVAEWNQLGLTINVSINLTVHDLLDLHLPETIAEIIGRSSVPATSVTFEITESTFMANPARARRVVTGIADLGCRLSIDDYGTGYSSLSHLRTLPVNELKIDRSFIANVHSEPVNLEIVRSTIHLAHTLGLTVVAEGVEQEEELLALRALRCDLVQGFLIGRPRPAASLTARLTASSPARSISTLSAA